MDMPLSDTSSSPAVPATARLELRRVVIMIATWNVVGSIVALLFDATFRPPEAGPLLPQHFLHAFVYANCIGTGVAVLVMLGAPRLSRFPFPADWAILTIASLLVSFAGTVAAASILMAFGSFPRDLDWLAPHRMGLGLLLGVISAMGLYAYHSIRLRLDALRGVLRAREFEEMRTRQLAAEASLSSLESRIRPHFLFNTLNSISSLISEEPASAERMIERLAALLRFSLDAASTQTIALGLELDITTDYLEIEKARYRDSLHYSAHVEDDLRSVRVPPFALQTLVENSVRHVVASRRAGGRISIGASRRGANLALEVRDDGPGFTERDIAPGHGLHNLRSRLAMLFEGGGELSVACQPGATVVTLIMPAWGGSR
ncbi:MAG TPA: histidine kinase [Thermoanaerobaculia bacterium]|nr:histidine kinase [Thermoanaerobaculia bacterium]